MSRWRVMKNHFADAWSVYREPPKDAGMVPWHRVPQWFDTWAEAMAYADKRARTIEVTLPRLGDDAIQILSREGLIPYNPAYAEEIAQAMLAINHLWR